MINSGNVRNPDRLLDTVYLVWAHLGRRLVDRCDGERGLIPLAHLTTIECRDIGSVIETSDGIRDALTDISEASPNGTSLGGFSGISSTREIN